MNHPRRAIRRAGAGAMTLAASIAAGGTVAAASSESHHGPATAPPPVIDDAQIEMAAAALAMFTIDNVSLPGAPSADVPCPTIPRERVAELLAAHGITQRPDGYAVGLDSDDLMAPVVYCGVEASLVTESPDPAGGYGYEIQAAYIDDPALFGQWTGELGATAEPAAPADAGLGGEYASRCVTGEGIEMCFAAWHRNGLVIRQYLAGPQTGTLQSRSDAILRAAVPEAIAGLAAYAGVELAAPEGTLAPIEVPQVVTVPVTPGPSTTTAGTTTSGASTTTAGEVAGPVPPADSAAARVALTRAGVALTTGATVDACPVVPQQRMEELAVAAGLTPRTTGYTVGASVDGYTSTALVSCGVPLADALATTDPAAPHTVVLQATYLDGGRAVQDLYDGLTISVTTPEVPDVGGELASGCQTNPDDPTAKACVVTWHRDGLVLAMYLVGPAADVAAEVAEPLLLSAVPDALTNLTAVPPVPPVADEATTTAIAAAAADADAAWVSAWYEPAAAEALTATFVPEGPAHFFARYLVDSMVEQGQTAAPNTATPYSFTVEEVAMLDAGIADVTVCVVDSTVMSDASGAVVNDSVAALRQRYTMVDVDGTWRVWQFAVLEVTDGATSCPDAPATSISVPPTTLGVAPG